MSIFQDIHVWLLIAFIMFFVIFFKYIKTFVNSFLNSKITNITKEISDSEKLLSDAICLLNERKKEVILLQEQQEHAVLKAQNNADAHYEKISSHLNVQVKNAKENYINYLKNKEQKITNDQKEILISKTLDDVKNTILDKIDEKYHIDLIDKSINNIEKLIKQ